MAKMVVNYAINVLWRELPKQTPEQCYWWDDEEAWESEEMKEYAKKACALWIMGIDMENFEPMRYVTRSQFWTILSRILWWEHYNVHHTKDSPYYVQHLNALKKSWIMTQIDNPEERIELREWVWVMLMRSEKYVNEENRVRWVDNDKAEQVIGVVKKIKWRNIVSW